MDLRLSRRISLVLLCAAATAVAARVAAAAPDRHAHFSAAFACDVERWSIKTLKDRPGLLRARPTTVAHFVGLLRPRPFPPPARTPLEHRIYSVVAAVRLTDRESTSTIISSSAAAPRR